MALMLQKSWVGILKQRLQRKTSEIFIYLFKLTSVPGEGQKYTDVLIQRGYSQLKNHQAMLCQYKRCSLYELKYMQKYEHMMT